MLTAIDNNKVNFTARLNLKNVENNLKQWKQADKILQEKTAKIPYSISVIDSYDCASICIPSRTDTVRIIGLSDKCLEKLVALTPEKMANKLIKLIKIFAKEDAENIKTIKLLRSFAKSEVGLEENFARFAEINAENTRKSIYKDNIFKDCEYII